MTHGPCDVETVLLVGSVQTLISRMAHSGSAKSAAALGSSTSLAGWV